ncbi:MAG: flavodoxin family protein [Thermodesulfobacteriota bacterium]
MKAALIYWSKSGNTEKVARVIKEALQEAGAEIVLKRVEEADSINFFNFNLICIGFPSYQWHPPEAVVNFLKNKFSVYRQGGKVKVGSPRISGKFALIFCTYSVPHTGINEAIPAGKYVGQFFDHLGFQVLDEWYILSEFHGSEINSTQGRMGDIRGKPTEEDLCKIKQNALNLIKHLKINGEGG